MLHALPDHLVVDHVEADRQPHADVADLHQRRVRPRRVLPLQQTDQIRGKRVEELAVRDVLAERHRMPLVVQLRRSALVRPQERCVEDVLAALCGRVREQRRVQPRDDAVEPSSGGGILEWVVVDAALGPHDQVSLLALQRLGRGHLRVDDAVLLPGVEIAGRSVALHGRDAHGPRVRGREHGQEQQHQRGHGRRHERERTPPGAGADDLDDQRDDEDHEEAQPAHTDPGRDGCEGPFGLRHAQPGPGEAAVGPVADEQLLHGPQRGHDRGKQDRAAARPGARHPAVRERDRQQRDGRQHALHDGQGDPRHRPEIPCDPADQHRVEDEAVHAGDEERRPETAPVEADDQESDRDQREGPDRQRGEGDAHQHAGDRGQPDREPQRHERAHGCCGASPSHRHTPA